jgi:acid phosphatase
MGGRIVIERMACPSSITNNQDSPDEIFLRVIVNDRPMSLRYCKSGPEFSCPLEELVDYVQRRRREVGEFGDVCGLEGDVGHITFLRQD